MSASRSAECVDKRVDMRAGVGAAPGPDAGSDRDAESVVSADAFAMELAPLRERIDQIDLQLLALLNERARVVGEIYAVKRQHGAQRLDRTRTREILARLAHMSAGPLAAHDVRALFAPLLRFFVERYAPDE